MVIAREFHRRALERSKKNYCPIGEEWVRKHISMAALLGLPKIRWNQGQSGVYWAPAELIVFRHPTTPNLGWFATRELAPLIAADGRQVAFIRASDAKRAAQLHANDGIRGGVYIPDGLRWQCRKCTTPSHHFPAE
jgi:hypothetical protein